jgi:hypothetical protein
MRAGGVAQVVEGFLTKCKAPSSNPSIAKKKEKKIMMMEMTVMMTVLG